MDNKRKKHKILGGIKVSSKQLSEWGSSGGRPKQYSSNAERARAFRLRKKQEKFGEKAGSSKERMRRFREKKPPMGSLKSI